MHTLPLQAGRYDHVFMMHALAYTKEPKAVLAETARLLKPGGKLIIAALAEHTHEETMRAYDHLNLGIQPEKLRKLLIGCGYVVESCRISRSEEHTSELQSLMRNSYAVFCLKKKINTSPHHI